MNEIELEDEEMIHDLLRQQDFEEAGEWLVQLEFTLERRRRAFEWLSELALSLADRKLC